MFKNAFQQFYFLIRILAEVKKGNKLNNRIIHNQEVIMATLAEVKQAVADEKAEVLAKLTALGEEIQALKDQIAAGSPVTAADLDELVASVHDIFTA